MTTNTAVGFRHTLLDDPDDLFSRRVYADWLEESASTDADRARLELLRLQLRLADWVPDLTEREELLRREVTLLERHGELVLGPLLQRVREWRYQRGILHVELSANQILQKVGRDDLRDHLRAAGVQVLRLETGARLRRVLVSSVLGVIPGLDLGRTRPTPHSLQPLLQATALENLRWLDLSVNQLDDQFLTDLAAAPVLRQLTVLDLRNNQFSPAALRRFIESCPDTLQRLELHGNYLDEYALPAYRDFLAERHVARPADQPFQRLVNSRGLEFRLIPAATFRQGSPQDPPETHRIEDEGPQHLVRLTRPYWIGLYQVPQWIYVELMGENPSQYHGDNNGGPCHPVDSPTYEQAIEFCRLLSALPEERAAGRRYRLPTEAEWEFAARGGLLQTAFAYGATLSSFQANFDGNSPAGNARRGPYVGHPVVVGSYPPNGFGLYDIHGNVWEWCSDFYDAGYYESVSDRVAVDPRGPETGERHVVRGGSWFSNGSYCRVACRGSGAGVDHLHNGGFRLVMEMA